MNRPTDHRPSPAPSDRLGPAVAPLLLLSSMFMINFLCRVAGGPLMPTIERDLGLSHTAAGSMFLSVSIGYFVSVLFSGFASARIIHRNLIALSSLAMGLIMIGLSLAVSAAGLRLGFTCLGLAAGVYTPSAVATITTLVTPRLWARGLAIHDMAPSMAFILSPLIAEVLLLWTGWRGALLAVGGAALALGLTYPALARGGRFTGQAPNPAVLRSLVSQPTVWIMGLLMALGVASMQGAFAMLPLYLMEVAGLTRPQANLMLSLSRVSCVGLILIAGWWADKMGHRRAVTISLTLGALTTALMGLLSGWALTAVIFIQPAVMTFFFPPAFALVSGVGDDKTRSLGVSLVVATGILLGVGLMPLIMGWLGDQGLFRWALGGLGGLMLASVSLSFRVPVRPGG